MSRNTVCIWLAIIWFLALATSLVSISIFSSAIPGLFTKFLETAIESFGPQFSMMIGFLIADEVNKRSDKESTSEVSTSLALFVLVISAFYAIFLVSPILSFAFNYMTAEESIQRIQSTRPLVSFLVTGIIAFLFGSASASTSSTKEPGK